MVIFMAILYISHSILSTIMHPDVLLANLFIIVLSLNILNDDFPSIIITLILSRHSIIDRRTNTFSLF